MNRILFFISIGFLLISCSDQQDRITNLPDFERYLNAPANKNIAEIDNEMRFWNKRFESVPDDISARTKIAGLLARRFSFSGNISELHKADSIYSLVLPLNRNSSAGTFRSMAVNCITQHKFRQAQAYIDSALRLGDDLYLTKLIEFDVAMELGNIARAKTSLDAITDQESFDFLIRKSKYKDKVEGNLDEAIQLMEKAFHKIKDNGSRSLYLWAKTNLGDMFGHANRFKESYQAYLDVLNLDPEYHHALKGIAWLAYSHDKDLNTAKIILEALIEKHPVPDYDLLLGEIERFQSGAKSNQHLESFAAKARLESYGDMYNKYLFDFATPKEALGIAQREVNNRPTGESYNLLAWAYYLNGDLEQAYQVAATHLENRCFEPDVLYHLGIIYLTKGNKDKARKYLTQARESAYELGPSISQKIEESLENL